MEFKEALLELYTTLSDQVPTDTEKVGVTFRYQELPKVAITVSFKEEEAVS